MDLIAKIQGMWNRPKSSMDTTKHTVKAPLRLPIKTPKIDFRPQKRNQNWTRLLL
jgi:hypothetical protein